MSILPVILGTPLSLPSAPLPTSYFREANVLYWQEKFGESTALYERIRAEGWESSALYYNLANAYFKQGNLGKAILNYRRAWNLSPRDPEINKNMKYAQEGLQDDITALPLGFFERLKLRLIRQLPLGAWLKLASSIYLLATIWIGAALLLTPLKKASPPVLKTLGVLFLLSLICSYLAFSYYRIPRAIIIEPEVLVRYGPQERDAVAFALHEGTEVKVIREQEGWTQIGLPDGKSGWLPSPSLGII